jgi:hypothetical protein
LRPNAADREDGYWAVPFFKDGLEGVAQGAVRVKRLAVVARENKATIQPIGSGLQAFTQLARTMSLERIGDELQQR